MVRSDSLGVPPGDGNEVLAMKRWILSAALLLLAGSQVWANGAPPPFQPNQIAFGSRNARLVVEVNAAAREPHLVIPAALVGQPGARPRGFGAGLTPTLVVALALTAAFVSGGFWLLRKGSGRTVVSLALFVSLAVLAGTASADIARPPRPPAMPGLPLPADIKLTEKIVVEVVPLGDSIRLIVPPAMVLKPGAVPEGPPEKPGEKPVPPPRPGEKPGE
jgi:hypothetical protein